MPETDEDERAPLTADAAIGALATTDRIHTFVNPAGMLVGADWDRSDAEDYIRGASTIEIAGDMARGMGHGIAAWQDDRLVYFAHNEDALASLEPAP